MSHTVVSTARMSSVGTSLPAMAALAAVLSAAPPDVGAQSIRWPEAGTPVRVTTLPGPPAAVRHGMALLGLLPDSEEVRRATDGRTRFTASLAGVVSATEVSFRRASGLEAATFSLADLDRVQVYDGNRSHGRTGFIIGAVVGGALGLALVNAVGESPVVGDYIKIGVGFALPPALVGGLLGKAIRTDRWRTIHLHDGG